MIARIFIRLAVGFSFAFVTNTFALEITRVNHEPPVFIPEEDRCIRINFTLSDDSQVMVKGYDDRDVLVRKINAGELTSGRHVIQWDGRDQSGKNVPAEAYRYTIVAEDVSGVTEHDYSDFTGIEQYKIDDVQWDSKNKKLSYQLKKPSRVFIRVGLKNHGPLMASLVNWVPRTSGKQMEVWDGMDASRVLDLSKHPELLIDAQAYTLPKNTMIIGPVQQLHSTSNNYLSSYPWGKESRKPKYQRKRRIVAPYQQDPQQRGDYLIDIKLPDDLPMTKKGLPIISGKVPILLTADPVHSQLALNKRSEPVIYVDGQFVFENEVGYLPMTWKIDVSTMNEGEHYITVNLRGYEGNFGIATAKVYVKHKQKLNQE